MVKIVYPDAQRQAWAGDIDLINDDIRVAIVMSNTTCDTEFDKLTNGAFTLVDLFDGANYVDKALSNSTLTLNAAQQRAEFDDTVNQTWTALGAGTRQGFGILIYKFVTDFNSSIPIGYTDEGTNLPFTANGGDITLTWNANGILHFGQAA